MTLTLKLPTDLERRLAQEAGRTGVSAAEYALGLLEHSLAAHLDSTGLANLLESWLQEDAAETVQDDETDLTGTIDGDRLSDRPLFPPELKGVTW